MQRQHSRVQETVSDDLDREINEAHNNILTTYNNMWLLQWATTANLIRPAAGYPSESGYND
jgi:hypothetical protein